MFFDAEDINKSEAGSQSIIIKVNDVIKKELHKISSN